MNEAVAPKYATLVPGAKSTLDALAARGIRVGSTTGYVRSIMKGVIPVAAAQGFSPECIVCADDVEGGRPGAEQMFLAFEQMSLNRGAKVLKVDDTEPGIAEGVAVGAVTVGVALSGNIAGLTVEDLMALPDDERAALLAKASGILRAAGADHVIETVADLPDLIEALEAKG